MILHCIITNVMNLHLDFEVFFFFSFNLNII